jgi:hypothetical protein
MRKNSKAAKKGMGKQNSMTSEQKIPPWGEDSLSRFFVNAEQNERVSALNLAPIYAVLQRVHGAFETLDNAIELDDREELVIPRFLIVRTHSAWLAAVRLGMSGQLPESYALLRVAIELSWYALHIAKDPHPPELANLWLSRNDDEASKSRCKSEFTVKRVRSTHKLLDSVTEKYLHDLYERAIESGGHPNEAGVFLAMAADSSREIPTYKQGILFIGNPLFLVEVLQGAVVVGVGALKIFELIFPQRFKIINLNVAVGALVTDLDTVFRQYLKPEKR